MDQLTLSTKQEIETIHLDIPASHKYLNVIGACIKALFEREESETSQESAAYQVELAVHEACTNIINHAYEGSTGRIKVVLSVVEEMKHRLVVDLIDIGQPFDTALLENLDAGEPRTSGYGLFLMHQLMDKITYSSDQGQNHWRMEKDL